jgi:hypothetical protein
MNCFLRFIRVLKHRGIRDPGLSGEVRSFSPCGFGTSWQDFILNP